MRLMSEIEWVPVIERVRAAMTIWERGINKVLAVIAFAVGGAVGERRRG